MSTEIWTAKQLAAAAKLNQSRIRQLLIAGKIKGQKIGRDWIVADDEARRWLESRGIEWDETNPPD